MKKILLAGFFPLSAFAGGLIIIPMLTALGSIAFFIAGVKAWRSGTRHYITTYDKDGFPTRKIKDTDDKLPWYKIPQFYFAIALAVATVVIIWAINSQA